MGHIYTVEEIKEKLLPIFEREPIVKAVLFGSYAKGTAREKSDIDLYVDSNGKLKGWNYYGVLDEVSAAFNANIDFIEASSVIEGGVIHRAITETGLVIYERA